MFINQDLREVIDSNCFGSQSWNLLFSQSLSAWILNFWIPLVSLVRKFLNVCIIFADTNEIDLQLEWTICFITQRKSDGVYL